MLLLQLPSENDLRVWRPVEVFVAPAGVKTFPPEGITADELQAMQWKVVRIGKSPDNIYHVGSGGLTAKREQYGLKPRIAATVHGLQGDTVAAIVTDLENNDLWESGQAIVMLSRTHYAHEMFFAGDADATVQCLIAALCCRNQFDEYLIHIVHQLSQNSTSYATTIDQVQHYPF